MKYHLGDADYCWTGRGSHGYATIREFRGGHFLLDPEPDVTKGSDFRVMADARTYWAPRDRGVLLEQIDTPPRFWYSNF